MQDFLKLLFHELKTPVSVIKGMSEILLEEKVSALKNKELIKRIHKNTINLEKILHALHQLEFSQKDETINLKKFNSIFIEAKKRILTNFKRAAIKLKIESFKTINLNPFLLETVLYNIFENSIKQKKFSIDVAVKSEEGFLKIHIRDFLSQEDDENCFLTSANLGHSLIKMILEKYEGKLETVSSKNSYEAIIFLK